VFWAETEREAKVERLDGGAGGWEMESSSVMRLKRSVMEEARERVRVGWRARGWPMPLPLTGEEVVERAIVDWDLVHIKVSTPSGKDRFGGI
jgi:hypothetical protein